MLFNSVQYLIFFALTYIVYWALRGKPRLFALISASVLFYAAWALEQEGLWGLRWTFHFLLVIGLNHLLINAMINHPSRKDLLIKVIVIMNLINLGTFKYAAFFRDFLLDLGVPVPETIQSLSIFLPLAISFYTFQLLAYAIDTYRGQITQKVPFHRFLLFTLFFPHFIAGPIMRSVDFVPQIDKPELTKQRLFDGSWLILGGLTKKILLADPMAQILAPVYAGPQAYTGWSIMLAGMCFSLQVYCDFSGYTDIARGSAKFLGFDIPENFDAPFFSRSARELWQRWHITLATWLRDYIYFPLGGNRIGPVRTYLNLIITFTLGGFWHGADYTYIAWGGMWGVLLAVERFLESKGLDLTPKKNPILIGLKIFVMFIFFSIGALMFRSQPTATRDAGEMMVQVFKGLFTNLPWDAANDFVSQGGDLTMMQMSFGSDVFRLNEMGPVESILGMFIALFLFHLAQYKKEKLLPLRKYDVPLLLCVAAILGGLLIPSLATASHQFIYFVF